jgi:hypothetical protein
VSTNAGLPIKICHIFFGIALVLVVFFAGGTFVLLVAWDRYGIQKIWDRSTLIFLGAAVAYVVTYYYSVRESKKAGTPSVAIAWALAPAIPLLFLAGAVIFS